MKPHQVRSNNRSTKQVAQAKPKPQRTVTVAIFNADTGFYCDPLDVKSCGLEDQIEIPEPLFRKLKAACKEFGITLEHFFKQAIAEKISREITRQSSAAVITALAWERSAR
jgi:hypothetical protein